MSAAPANQEDEFGSAASAQEPKHKAFAKRFLQAIEGIPEIPPPHHGRLGFLEERFNNAGIKATKETIRKWGAGLSKPRSAGLSKLAEYLKVDHAWFAFGVVSAAGSGAVPQASQRQLFEDGSVTLVAALIQMGGGSVELAEEAGVSLRAIIRGAQYALNVVAGQPEGEGFSFDVPDAADRDTVLTLGVVLSSGPKIDVFEIEPDALESGEVHDGFIRVTGGENELRRIENFSRRI